MKDTTMENRNTFEDGTADQYREELQEEMALTIYCGCNDADVCWGLGFDGYMMLLTDELMRVTK